MEFAKMLLQRFAEESETTDSNVEEEETIDEEYDDSSESAEEVENEETTAEEPEKVKTFTQEEVNEMFEKRIKRERKKLDRQYQDKLSKYEELAYLTQKGLEVDNFEEALDKTRQFYDEKGIKYSPKSNNKDEEILANAYAQEIIDECDSIEDLEDAISNINKKGDKLSERDSFIIKGLDREIKQRQRLSQLSELGVSEDVYNSSEFRSFESKFNENTPISDIYELYNTTQKSKSQFKNPGSMKSVPSAEKKDFISEKEYDRMTDKEIEENMELIRNSMSRW